MKIILAILIFSFVVLIHELGHFLLAKANHIKVEQFAIGMGPTLVSKQIGETKYSIKLLPFGGFCAMEGEDEEVVSDTSFGQKSVWARISVVLAGPGFNLILAFLVSLIIIAMAGVAPARVVAVQEGSPEAEAGLLEGDIITKFDGSGISTGQELYTVMQLDGIPSDKITMTVKRDGEKQVISYKPESEEKYMLGYTYYPDVEGKAEIIAVTLGSAMAKAGIQPGDIILEVDGTVINSNQELSAYFEEHPLDGTPVELTYQRGNKLEDVTVTPVMESNTKLGFAYNLAREKQGFFSTIRYGVSEVKYWVKVTVKSIAMLFTGKVGVNDLSGPVGVVGQIGDTIEQSQEDGTYYVVLNLLNFVVLLSANLGVMNLIPFPALDGGRFLVLFIEAVTKKRMNAKVEGAINFVGLMLLMALMVFVMFNDIRKLF